MNVKTYFFGVLLKKRAGFGTLVVYLDNYVPNVLLKAIMSSVSGEVHNPAPV